MYFSIWTARARHAVSFTITCIQMDENQAKHFEYERKKVQRTAVRIRARIHKHRNRYSYSYTNSNSNSSRYSNCMLAKGVDRIKSDE